MAKFSDLYVSALVFARNGNPGKAIETLCDMAEASGADSAEAKAVLQFVWATHAIDQKHSLYKRVQKILTANVVVEILQSDGFSVVSQEEVVGRPMTVMTRDTTKVFVPSSGKAHQAT